MIAQIRNSVLFKVFWGLMGVLMLNISVDSVDPNPKHIPENLTINDQESIIEIFVEKILGFEDAIKEYDDHDSENHNTKNNVKIDIVFYPENSNFSYAAIETTTNNFPEYYAHLIIGFHDLDTPPPKI